MPTRADLEDVLTELGLRIRASYTPQISNYDLGKLAVDIMKSMELPISHVGDLSGLANLNMYLKDAGFGLREGDNAIDRVFELLHAQRSNRQDDLVRDELAKSKLIQEAFVPPPLPAIGPGAVAPNEEEKPEALVMPPEPTNVA